tara:strand:- start:8932 stop:10767 length:1836 start_codon:yes stop_codon:yes gene_type:complete
MAENLLKLQPLGLQFKVPQTDFVGSRVQAQAMSELSANLDSMSNYLFKIAEQRAKIEGAEYGAETAPTAKQIEEAYNAGEEIPLGGDKFTVYGSAIRNAQLSTVSNELEYLARTKVAEVTKKYNTAVEQYGLQNEDGKKALDPQNYLNEINEIVAGYAATLDNASPGYARKFRAKISLENNTKYLSYADKFIGEHNKVMKATVIAGTELVVNDINTAILGYFKNNQDATEQLKTLTKESMSQIIMVGGDTVGFNNRLNEAIRTSAKNIVVNELLANPKPKQFLPEMYAGEFNKLPGDIGKAMKLAEDYGINRKDFIKQVNDQYDAKIKAQEDAKKLQIAKNEESINFAIADAIAFLADDQQDKANELMLPFQLDQLPGTSEELISWEKISKAYEEAKITNFKDNTTTVQKLTRKLFSIDNPLTLGELITEFENKQIGQSTFTSMASKINSLANQQMSDARTYILDETGHNPEIRIDDPEGDQALKERVFREIMGDVFEAELQAKLEGKPFSAILTAKNLMESKGTELIAKRIKSNRKNAISTIQEIATIIESTDAVLAEKFKNVTDDTLDSLITEAIGTAEEIIADYSTKYKNFSKTIIQGYPIILGRKLR